MKAVLTVDQPEDGQMTSGLTRMAVAQCIQTARDRQQRRTLVHSVIDMIGNAFPHSHSQTIVQSLGHKQFLAC